MMGRQSDGFEIPNETVRTVAVDGHRVMETAVT